MPLPPLWPVSWGVARGAEKGTAHGELCNNCSGGFQSPESSMHAKVRAFAVDGVKVSKHKKQEVMKTLPGRRRAEADWESPALPYSLEKDAD